MTHTLNRLATNAATASKKPGVYSDGGGLYLRITKAGSRQWVFIYHREGRRREFGLGGTLTVPLTLAREKAKAAREVLGRGGDPIKEKEDRRKRPTFGALADEWMTAREGSVRNAKSIARWKRTLGREGFAKSLRPIQVDAIRTDEVLAVLKPIWTKGPTATLARGYIEAVLDAAAAQKHRDGENPARWKGHLEHLLARAPKLTRGHHAALPYSDLPTFMSALRAKKGTPALALEFIVLTAVRSGEALGATLQEIDREAKLWTIPAKRMKAGKAHTVPLSDAAMKIVDKLWPEDETPDALLFNNGGNPLSGMACSMLMRRMKTKATVHGFRSAFRDWAGDMTEYPRDLLETALAHSLGSVEAAYRRATALEKRRDLMRDWAVYCGKVELNKQPAAEAA